MVHHSKLDAVEADVYRSRFDDGLIDCFLGLSLLWIGVCWLWFEDLAAMAGVLPAVMVVPFLAARRSFLERRAGYVRFAATRRRWERRNLLLVLLGGAVTLLAGIGAFLAVDGGSTVGDIVEAGAPGLVAVLLAVAAFAVAAMTGIRRFIAYAVVLLAAGVAAALLEANPGAPVLVGGVPPTVWGVVLVTRFIGVHPRRSVEG